MNFDMKIFYFLREIYNINLIVQNREFRATIVICEN